MKWIGQHIYDLISRFRSDVYLEDLSATSETNMLIADSAGKVSKRSMSSLTAGSVTVTDNNASSYQPVVFHDGSNNLLDDTGSFQYYASICNLDLTAAAPSLTITSNTNDANDGHLIFANNRGGNDGQASDSCGTITFSGMDDATPSATMYGSYEVAIGSPVATDEYGITRILNRTSDGSTSQLQQALIATGHGTNNTVDIGLGYGATSTTTVAGNLLAYGQDHLFESGISGKPQLQLKNINTDNKPASIKFLKDAGEAGADGDFLGSIIFSGDNSAQEITDFGRIRNKIVTALDTDEAGEMDIQTATSQGGSGISGSVLQNVIKGVGHGTNNTVDVELGYGAASTTTVAGNLTVTSDLTVSGTTTTINTANLNVEDKNIALNYNASGDTSSTADGAGITIQDAVDASTDASLTWTAASDTFTFSHPINATLATASQPNITTLAGFLSGTSAGSIITDDTDGTVTSHTDARITTTNGLSYIHMIQGGMTALGGTNRTVGAGISYAALKSHSFIDPDNGDHIIYGTDTTISREGSYSSGTMTVMAGNFSAQDIGSTGGGTLNLQGVRGFAMSTNSLAFMTQDNLGGWFKATGGDSNVGVKIETTDGATSEDLKIVSSADTGDYFSISTTTHGATEIATLDDDAHAADLTFNVDGFTKFRSPDNDGGGVEIETGTAAGVAALTIDNNDVDVNALLIEAANTTNHVLDIESGALTTHDAIHIKADSLTTGSAINLDINDSLTTSATKSLLKIDYDKSGVTASGQTSMTAGLDINMKDLATNHASGTVSNFGAVITLDAASNQGDIQQTGLGIYLADADIANSTGIYSQVEDGGVDFKAVSSASSSDYFTIATGEDGETTFTTVENGGGSTAHMHFNADGDINLNPSMNAASSINMLMVDSNNTKGIKGTIDGVSNECFIFHGVAGDYTELRMFAGGGDTNALNDYLYINSWENGASIIGTVDADAALANIDITPNGDLKLRPSTGNTEFSSSTSAKPLVTLKTTNTTKTTSAELKFAKDAANVEDEEVLGQVSFYGDNFSGAQTKHADITVKVNDINAGNYSLAEMNLNILNHNQSGAYYSTGLKLFGKSDNDRDIDVNIASGVDSVTTIAGNLDIDGTKITSAGNLTLDTVGDLSLDPHTDKDIFFKENGTERFQFHLDSTPTMEVTGNFDIDGSGDITLDAVGDIILVAAGNDITVDADNFNMASGTGFRPEINLTATGTAPTKAAQFNFIKDAADTEDGEYLGIINFIGEDEGDNMHNFATILGSIAESDEGAEGGKLDFQVANHDGGLESGLTITDGDADGELDVTIAAGVASTTTVAGDLIVSGGNITGPTDSSLNILSDDSMNFAIDKDNDQTSFFNWYANGVPHGSNLLMMLADTGSLLVGGPGSTQAQIQIKDELDNAGGPGILFRKQRGNTGSIVDAQDNDIVGDIYFNSYDDGTPSTQTYAHIQSTIADATDGQEAGKLSFYVAEYDGTSTTAGLVLDGDTNADGEIDVTIGAGAASTTTVAGNLNITTGVTGSKAGQIVHFQPTSYMYYCFYMNSKDQWYSPSSYATGAGNAAKDSISFSYSNQGNHAGYIAPRACKIKKIMISMYANSSGFTSSDDIAIEWAALKWTPGDNSSAVVSTTDMTMTDCDGNYREVKIYSKTFTVTDNAASALAAGDVFNFFGRVTNQTPAGSNTVRVLWRGDVTYEIELTE